MVDALGGRAGECAVGSGGIGQRVNVDGEGSGHTDRAGDVGIGSGVGGTAVAPLDEVIPPVGHGCHRSATTAVVDTLGGRAGERAVGSGGIGQSVNVDGEGGGHVDRAGDVGIGSGVGGAAVAPLDEVVPLVGNGGDRGAVSAVADALGGRAGECTVGPGGIAQSVGVDGEGGGDGVVGCDVGEGVRAYRAHGRAFHQNIHDVVAAARGDRKALAGAVVNAHTALRGDTPPRGRCSGDRIGVDGEGGGHTDRAGDVGVGSGVGGTAVAPLDEVVSPVGNGGDRGTAAAVVDTLGGRAGECAVGPGGIGQSVNVDGEGSGDSVVGGDVGEGVGAHRARGRAVHQNTRDVVACARGDRKALAGAWRYVHASRGREAPPGSGGGCNGERADGVELVVKGPYVDSTVRTDSRGGVERISR